MDIIRYTHTGTIKTLLKNARIVNGIKSITWIERYTEPGEFTIVADLSEGVEKLLPIDSFISHTETLEVMIVENHQISYSKDKPMEVIITGRSYETYFSHRVAAKGSFLALQNNKPVDLVLSGEFGPGQTAISLINYITNPSAFLGDDTNDHLPHAEYGIDHPYVQRPAEYTPIQRGDLHTRIKEVLTEGKLGIRIERPSPENVTFGTAEEDFTKFVVHDGKDKSTSVVFSHDKGEIEHADYLWSIKDYKTAAVVTSTWFETNVYKVFNAGFARRAVFVDATDIDSHFDSTPTGLDADSIQAQMFKRGQQALARKKSVEFASVAIAKDATRYKYRKDYGIGDIVGVRGLFSAYAKMRVIEHVAILDKDGLQTYPTLSADAV